MDLSIVPEAPAGLCFTRDKFVKEDFSADCFLQDFWNSVPLEILRDDLGAYLKVLRSSMIELINRDYADFVNLSSNLVGIDKAIITLQEPLTVIHSEILAVERVLSDAHNKLLFTLSERQALREKKSVLECLMRVPQCLDHLEKLLGKLSSETFPKTAEDTIESGNVMERAANEYSQLQHLLVKCNNTSVVAHLKERINQASSKLMKCLEDMLVYSIEQQKKDTLQKSLRTFVLLDQCKFAEHLVRIRIIHPFVEKLLNESSLKMEPRDLNGLFTRLKDFLRHQLKDLVDISGSFEGPRGFNLIVNCLWPEIYHSLVDNLDCIFAQGNPDLLHKRYCCTVEFLEYLECLAGRSSAQILRNDPNYELLMARWNLEVYFLMRFQDIAGNLERHLIKPFDPCTEQETKNPVHFRSTLVLCELLHSCYAPNIYLPPLTHRFWKLTLQLIARYQTKLKSILQEHEQMKRNEISTNASLTPSNSSCRLPELAESPPPATSLPRTDCAPVSLQRLVHLDSDVRFVLNELPTNVWSVISKKLEQLGVEDREVFQNALGISIQEMDKLVPKITQLIIDELSSQCCAHLKNVSDIPRLYRRTNREIPTKSFAYVHQLLAPLIDFRNVHAGRQPQLQLWTRGVLANLSKQYLAAVSDVLTSVQRTEDSLKRLRKDRVPITASSGTSDDDKIRLQLIVDVDTYVAQSRSFVDESMSEIDALSDIVESARAALRRSPANMEV